MTTQAKSGFDRLRASPLLVRIIPFLVFAGLTFLQSLPFEGSPFWIYFGKTLAGAWILWIVWPAISEMRWNISWEAVAAGVGVFVLWVGLDPFYRKLNLGQSSAPWNPFSQFGEGSGLAWFFVVCRILGSSIVVPPLEEVFYRSFLYRYIIRPDFEAVRLGQFHWIAFLVTSAIFGFAHREWLAGILCGFIYQGLVIRKGRLGDAMTAHAITNLLLGIWVVWKGAWEFW